MARNGVIFDVLHKALASDESALIINFAIFNGIFLNKGWTIEKMLKNVLFSFRQCDFLKNSKAELFCKQKMKIALPGGREPYIEQSFGVFTKNLAISSYMAISSLCLHYWEM